MGTLTLGLLLLAGVWSLAYFGASLMIWTGAIALGLITLQWFGVIGWSAILWWPLFLAVVVPLHLPQIRKTHLSSRAFQIFRKILPPMSDTERAAIEAGDVWWEGQLFQGKPKWQEWINLERPALSSEEQSFIDNQVNELLELVDDWKSLQETKDLSPEAWDFIKREKFFGMIIPKQYGGLEFSALAQSTIISKISSHCVSAAVTSMVPNSLGPAELLLKYGTEQQKDYYLPKLANGTEIPCFALTSPVAGSDAGSIQDRGVICNGTYNGKQVLGIKLTWDKRYITLAPIATVLGLAFKLYDPEHLLGDKVDLGITACLVPTNTPGVEIGKRHLPLNQAFMNGPTRGEDVFIPIDWIIGGRERVGQGWKMLMECLSVGRAISLPALSTSCTQLSYRMTGAYARLREQFKTPIGFFEGVQEGLSRIGGFNYIVESTRQVTSSSVDLGMKPAVVSAIAKYHMTELARKSVNDSMDIHGGKAIIMGPNNYLANMYQVQPVSITVEGANILTRSLMIFGQGAIRCHPFVQAEINAASLYEQDAKAALDNFDKAFFAHIKYGITNFAKSFFQGLTCAWGVMPPKRDEMSRYFQKLSWMSSVLAFTSDVAMMTMGGKLKKSERLSARLGDVLSHLYLNTCVLKFYYENGAKEIDQSHVHWASQYCLHQCQTAFYDFYANFPMRWVGRVMRFMMFPFGAHCRMPSDELGSDVALKVMEDTELRDRLTSAIYLSEKGEGAGLVDRAFKKFFEVSPILAKLNDAARAKEIDRDASLNDRLKTALSKGIIDAQEKKQVIEFEKLRSKVIAVDEFSPDYFAGKSQWKTKNITLKAEKYSS